MTIDRKLLDRIRSRGEEMLTQLSAELMSNPRFVKAVNGALRGREALEQAATSALRQMNVPTRGELKRANSRIEALEDEIAALRTRVSAARARGKGGAAGKRPVTAASAQRSSARRPAAGRRKVRTPEGGSE